jgi:hypothetical protein
MSPDSKPEPKPRLPLSRFRAILLSPAKDGEPLFIVGGHAVNSWAHNYIFRRPELAQYRPFTSKDLDCVGSLDDVWHLHQATGWEYLPGKPDPKEFVAGAIRHRPKDGPVLLVEVLKRTQGADLQELFDHAIEIEFSAEGDRHRVRVPDPVLMMKLKMENSICFKQDTPGNERQDIKHVRMMTICSSAYLEQVVEMDDLSVKDRIDALNGSLQDLIELNEKHYHTDQFRQKYGWAVKSCVPGVLVEVARNEDPVYRQLRKNLERLGF